MHRESHLLWTQAPTWPAPKIKIIYLTDNFSQLIRLIYLTDNFSQFSPSCLDKLQQYFNQNIPEKFKCKYPQMPEIDLNLNGIIKLLSNLRPDKAAGPDEIKPVVLRELRNEIVVKTENEKS